MSDTIGCLLMNVGTPTEPTTPAVRRYLRAFLSDPRVLDMSRVWRWCLLNGMILPFRPRRSAAAYRTVWTDEGPPLRVISRAFCRGLQAALGERYHVVMAMRYGAPSIADGIAELTHYGARQWVIFPLYPQYATSSTASALAEVFRCLQRAWNVPPISVVPPFFADAGFMQAFAAIARSHMDPFQPDHLLFSFHGLPERHLRKSDVTGTRCLQRGDCCTHPDVTPPYCYRAQCLATAAAIATRLGLAANAWSVAFQSRLGRDPWIKPYTDHVIVELARKGVRRLAVICPAFVADCLETLEEIGIRGAESFRAAGGEELQLIPSLNANATWIDAAANLVRRAVTT